MHSSIENLSKIISLIKDGKVGVMPTDTIYGIVGSALNPQTVEKIYKLRKRAKNKPFIILISSLNDLDHFNIQLTEKQRKFLQKIWPNPVSVILPCPDDAWKYLHRGTKTLAFRIPKSPWLIKMLKKAGPLVAPSANYEGGSPAETIDDAKKYFGNEVFYVDSGKLKSQPSTLIELQTDGSYKILREGNFKL